jgi:hypothetical protein
MSQRPVIKDTGSELTSNPEGGDQVRFTRRWYEAEHVEMEYARDVIIRRKKRKGEKRDTKLLSTLDI